MPNKDVIWLGPAPAEESCAQPDEPDYHERAFAECRQYIKAIKQKCGKPPDGAKLGIKSQQHVDGTYYEVVVEFDPMNDDAALWAYHADANVPTTWAEVGMSAPSMERGRGR